MPTMPINVKNLVPYEPSIDSSPAPSSVDGRYQSCVTTPISTPDAIMQKRNLK